VQSLKENACKAKCTLYPTFLDMGPSSNESMELQGLRMTRIFVASEKQHFGNLLKKPVQVLLRPGQYPLLGARIVVLLKEISELPLLPNSHEVRG
jgi:hypothetical protein